MNEYECYLVGGFLRDELLGRSPGDRDWVVVGATAEQLLDAGYRQVGRDFPVFLHPESKEEYALARTERKEAPGHRGFLVDADPSVTLEQDLQRRDLTINAMARSLQGALIDPLGGQQDLEDRLLRHVSEAFSEDPLRVLRVARFGAQLSGFAVAPETLALMQQMVKAGQLRELSAERVCQEFLLALASDSPIRFFEILEACQGLQDWFPEIMALPMERLGQALLQGSPQRRFARLPLTEAEVDGLAERLRLPQHYRQGAVDRCRHEAAISAWPNVSAGHLYEVFAELRVWHKSDRLVALLGALLPEGVAEEAARVLAEGIKRTKAVQPASGPGMSVPTGKAYGEALKAARISELGAWLNQLEDTDRL